MYLKDKVSKLLCLIDYCYIYTAEELELEVSVA